MQSISTVACEIMVIVQQYEAAGPDARSKTCQQQSPLANDPARQPDVPPQSITSSEQVYARFCRDKVSGGAGGVQSPVRLMLFRLALRIDSWTVRSGEPLSVSCKLKWHSLFTSTCDVDFVSCGGRVSSARKQPYPRTGMRRTVTDVKWQ